MPIYAPIKTPKTEPARLFAHVASNLPRHVDQKSVGRILCFRVYSFVYTEPLTGHLRGIFQTLGRCRSDLCYIRHIWKSQSHLQQRHKIGLDKQMILDSSILTFSCLNRGEHIKSDRWGYQIGGLWVYFEAIKIV